ncbi:MAG: hypothetical protein ACI8RZ_006567 [Myxococcota bacterium]|jgi:hypothetical protein
MAPTLSGLNSPVREHLPSSHRHEAAKPEASRTGWQHQNPRSSHRWSVEVMPTPSAGGALSRGRPQPGAPSAGAETALEVPPHFKASPISALDVAYLSCSPFGLLSVVAMDSEGCPLPGWLRFAIVRAMLFLATPRQRWPDGPLMALRSRGAALPAFAFGSLRECPPCGRSPCDPPPGHQLLTTHRKLKGPSCAPQSAGCLLLRVHAFKPRHPNPPTNHPRRPLHQLIHLLPERPRQVNLRRNRSS